MYQGREVVGIVMECNPFHEGHAYFLSEIRQQFGDPYIVAVMSGDFVQRGEPAICSKYDRAMALLRHGVDLVLQMPVIFSTSSAENFALCAVAMLRGTGVVDRLVFGSESGDLAALQEAAGRIEELEFSDIQENLRRGLNFPRAWAEACRAAGIALPEKPNDILGLAYLRAAKGLGWEDLALSCIRRDASYPSAHALREQICQSACAGNAPALDSAPCALQKQPYLYTIDRNAMHGHAQAGQDGTRGISNGHPGSMGSIGSADGDGTWQGSGYAFPDQLSDMLSYRLWALRREGIPFTDFLDVSRELSDRIRQGMDARLSFTERVRQAKTKHLSYARISRAFAHILLSIRAEDAREAGKGLWALGHWAHNPEQDAHARASQVFGSYLRVLGISRRGQGLLGQMCCPPLVSLSRWEKLHPAVAQDPVYRADLFAAGIYRQILPRAGNEYTEKLLLP